MTPGEDRPPEPSLPPHPRLKLLRLRGNPMLWGLIGAIVSILGLFLIGGLAASPWLFLLYPLLIGLLLISLGVLALHLLHRF
jgi:hypothetical protein